MGDTKIEWSGKTWNPLAGCSHCSPGCDACYAAREAAGRLSGHPVYEGLSIRLPGEPAKFTGEIRLLPDRLDQPIRWQAGTKIFVNSMSDLFHRDVPTEYIAKVFAVMKLTPRHTYQVLTKRPRRMREIVCDPNFRQLVADAEAEISAGLTKRQLAGAMTGHPAWPLENVWLGTSIENDRYTFRADHIRETPAAVRFLSVEPLIGPVPSLDVTGIDWVIVGGESGTGARKMELDWVREVVAIARVAGAAPFVKQLGSAWGSDHKNLVTFPEDLQIRELPS